MSWNECKTIRENKNITNKYRYLLESNFVGSVNRSFVLVYSNQAEDSKRYKAKRYYLTKGVTKNYVIINENLYDQSTESDIERYEEIRKLTTLQY